MEPIKPTITTTVRIAKIARGMNWFIIESAVVTVAPTYRRQMTTEDSLFMRGLLH